MSFDSSESDDNLSDINSLESVESAYERSFVAIEEAGVFSSSYKGLESVQKTDLVMISPIDCFGQDVQYDDSNMSRHNSQESTCEGEDYDTSSSSRSSLSPMNAGLNFIKIFDQPRFQETEEMLFKWEYTFYMFAARNFLRQLLESSIDKKIQIPIPRCLRKEKKKVVARLVCTEDIAYDTKCITINGKKVDQANFRGRLEHAKEYYNYNWKDDPFAGIVHYYSAENLDKKTEKMSELILPEKEILEMLRIQAFEKKSSFADELAYECIPMFPFSDINRSPPFYGNDIIGFKVGIYGKLMLEQFAGTLRNFDVYEDEDGSDCVFNCFKRAFDYTLHTLEAGLKHPQLENSVHKKIVVNAVQACKDYKAHFVGCFEEFKKN